MRGCLVGCGFVSRFHLAAWTSQSRGRIVAVCDLDHAKAADASRAAACNAYADAAEMLRRERPDFVEICTQPDSHLALVTLAAEHGAHVLCQKPAAPTLDALREMIAVCAGAGVRLMIHENFRWRAWNLRLKAALDSGLVGEPFRLSLAMHDPRCLLTDGLSDQPYFAVMSRLILYEIGPHAIDFARYMLGEPDRVFAVTRRIGPQRGEDLAQVTLWFPNGRIANIDLSWATARRENARPEWGLHDTALEGDRGTSRTRVDGQLGWFPVGHAAEVLPVSFGPDPLVESYAATQAHFLECLETGKPFDTGGKDTLKTMQIVFAAYESAASHSPRSLSQNTN